jgi:hypothetical protein
MSQWDYQNFPKSNEFFFKESGVCDQISLSIFVPHISANFHTKKEKIVMTCKFECFQSHYHILKELHESFLVTYGLLTKSFGDVCTI